MVFMKGNEKKERETRKKAEKEALDKAKKEEDLREAKRAARKLNFLITQTELYSHFVGSKIKSAAIPRVRRAGADLVYHQQPRKPRIRKTPRPTPSSPLRHSRAPRSRPPSPPATPQRARSSRSSTLMSVRGFSSISYS